MSRWRTELLLSIDLRFAGGRRSDFKTSTLTCQGFSVACDLPRKCRALLLRSANDSAADQLWMQCMQRTYVAQIPAAISLQKVTAASCPLDPRRKIRGNAGSDLLLKRLAWMLEGRRVSFIKTGCSFRHKRETQHGSVGFSWWTRRFGFAHDSAEGYALLAAC